MAIWQSDTTFQGYHQPSYPRHRKPPPGLRGMRGYGVVENNMIEPTAGDATGNRSEVDAAAPRRLEIHSAIAILPDLYLRRDLPENVGLDEGLAFRRQVVGEHVAVTDDRDLGFRIAHQEPSGEYDGRHDGFQMSGRHVDDETLHHSGVDLHERRAEELQIDRGHEPVARLHDSERALDKMSTPESYCSGWPERKCSRDASKKAPDIGGLFACRFFF